MGFSGGVAVLSVAPTGLWFGVVDVTEGLRPWATVCRRSATGFSTRFASLRRVTGAAAGVVAVVGLIRVVALDFDAFDRDGLAGGGVDFGEDAAHPHVAGGDVEVRGHAGGHELEHLVLAAAEDR